MLRSFFMRGGELQLARHAGKSEKTSTAEGAPAAADAGHLFGASLATWSIAGAIVAAAPPSVRHLFHYFFAKHRAPVLCVHLARLDFCRRTAEAVS